MIILPAIDMSGKAVNDKGTVDLTAAGWTADPSNAQNPPSILLYNEVMLSVG